MHTASSTLHRLQAAVTARRLPLWSVPLVLLGLVAAAYGLRGLSLGFYWDDWPYLWYFHVFGAPGIVDAFTADRPFLSFIYTLTLSILGDSARAWQVFALLAHWLSCVALWGVLALTWPRSAHKAAWAAMLFAVYPGFTQHWIAVIYGQAFLLMALPFFSMAVTLWLARRAVGRAAWVGGTLLALLLSALTMFSTEYFFGLELLRPLLLWLVQSQTDAAPIPAPRGLTARLNMGAARRALRLWLPYLALMLVFAFWRGVLQPFPEKSLIVAGGGERSPLAALAGLLGTIVEDIIEASLAAWGQVFRLEQFLEAGPGGLRLAAFMLALGAAALLALLALRPRRSEEPSWALQAGLVGGLAVLAAGWPFWITGLPMRMGFPQDRYSLPLAVGVCLLLAALIDGLLKDWPRKALVLASLLALAAGFHFQTALRYREDWNNMRSLFWQLAWRAPGVQPNTLFLFDRLPFQYYEDDSLTAVLNWMYAPDFSGRQMPYLLYDMLVRRNSLPSFARGQPVLRDFRATYFEGSTLQVLVVDLQAAGCAHVLDPLYHGDLYHLPYRVQVALPLSDPARWILPGAPQAAPPGGVFGPEPPRRWCYYYQRAELARQQEDWQAVRALAAASLGAGYKPEDPLELLPFVEGFARLGLYDDAAQLSVEANSLSPALRPAVCAIWRRAVDLEGQNARIMGDSLQRAIEQMNADAGCAIE